MPKPPPNFDDILATTSKLSPPVENSIDIVKHRSDSTQVDIDSPLTSIEGNGNVSPLKNVQRTLFSGAEESTSEDIYKIRSPRVSEKNLEVANRKYKEAKQHLVSFCFFVQTEAQD